MSEKHNLDSQVVLGEVNRQVRRAKVQLEGVAKLYFENPWKLPDAEREAANLAVEELNHAKDPVAVLNYWNALTHVHIRPPAEMEEAFRLVREAIEAIDHSDIVVIQRLVAISNNEHSEKPRPPYAFGDPRREVPDGAESGNLRNFTGSGFGR